MCVSALAQEKPDPRIYVTPQDQPQAQNTPDYRNQPEQPESDYRDQQQQDSPDYRRVIAGVDGVSVHHFRFPGDGMYDPRILADVRQQYRAAGWQHISASHARGGRGETDVWVRLDNMTIRNVVVLVARANQVNF